MICKVIAVKTVEYAIVIEASSEIEAMNIAERQRLRDFEKLNSAKGFESMMVEVLPAEKGKRYGKRKVIRALQK